MVAMPQLRQLVIGITMEAWVHFHGNPCGFTGEQSIGTGFLLSTLVVSATIILPLLHVQSYIIQGMVSAPISSHSSIEP
jgi:hypothetical protein